MLEKRRTFKLCTALAAAILAAAIVVVAHTRECWRSLRFSPSVHGAPERLTPVWVDDSRLVLYESGSTKTTDAYGLTAQPLPRGSADAGPINAPVDPLSGVAGDDVAETWGGSHSRGRRRDKRGGSGEALGTGRQSGSAQTPNVTPFPTGIEAGCAVLRSSLSPDGNSIAWLVYGADCDPVVGAPAWLAHIFHSRRQGDDVRRGLAVWVTSSAGARPILIGRIDMDIAAYVGHMGDEGAVVSSIAWSPDSVHFAFVGRDANDVARLYVACDR